MNSLGKAANDPTGSPKSLPQREICALENALPSLSSVPVRRHAELV